MVKEKKIYHVLLSVAVLLAFVVIILGAYTRLKDAGLGCPDWPGCYAQFKVPQTQAQLVVAAQEFPGQVVEPEKAWLEMIHRYFAGTLALFTIGLSLWALFRFKKIMIPRLIPAVLVAMIFFQAALGMWTVTLKLMPLVVMGHLLGGFTVLSLLWVSWLKTSPFFKSFVHNADKQQIRNRFKPWAILAIVLVVLQIALGGWTSSNYAALVCPGLPLCHGTMMPAWDVHHAFQLWTPFEQLSYAAKMTIQMFHRMGAVIISIYLVALALVYIIKMKRTLASVIAIWMLLALFIQICLGLLNIILILPVPIAVAHNAMAAFLLLMVITFAYSVHLE